MKRAQSTMVVGLGLLVLVAAAGCPTASEERASSSADEPLTGCSIGEDSDRVFGRGSRTVTDIPDAGTWQCKTTITLVATPRDSALGQLLESELGKVETRTTDYDVGAGGELVGTDDHLVVSGGCLETEFWRLCDEPQGDAEPSEDEDDPPPENPCSEYPGVPLGPNGYGDQGEGFICLAYGSWSYYKNCWQDDWLDRGTWDETWTTKQEYTAMGAIAGVTATDPDTGETVQYDIQEGDTATIIYYREQHFLPAP